MADVLTFLFRSLVSQTGATNDYKVIPPSPAARSTLVVGDGSMSRSLLLLSAVSAASDMDMKVFFFTQTQIQKLPAPLHNCENRSPEGLKKIKFCYPRTVHELLQQVSSLQEPANMSPTAPSLIIVDGLEGYLRGAGDSSHTRSQSGELSCAAHVSSLLWDTAAFFTQVLEQRAPSLAPCRVIASFQPEVDTGQTSGEPSSPDPILDVLDRYFQVCCTLERDRSYGAVAAGLQEEVWHINLSAIREDSGPEAAVDTQSAGAQEWELLIFPDGLMEFKVV
ncbi:ATPase SWSAP1 [Genypterus blacodes]|uniref:ATPase SWSAP1 n=1 Tax=Genypterus blacodes TaxID=154954 RepID=UPI003F763BFD